MKIIVIGAGAWGTALAISAARNTRQAHAVTLWARDASAVDRMESERCNSRYLPGCGFPPSLRVSASDLSSLLASSDGGGFDLIIIATPMAGLRETLLQVAAAACPVAWLCKGFEAPLVQGAPGLLGHEVLQSVAPCVQAGVLSGPSFAQEVAAGQPTALVAASPHESVRLLLVDAFHSPDLRVYANEDVAGVEVGGAVKNVLAIATGLCDGLDLGMNARAALITRGLAEMTRLGMAMGAKAETFMGLSGLGDLVLTATGDLSRNRKVGLALASGKTLEQAVAELGHVAEGVYSARTVWQRAVSLGVPMPITQAVVGLLDGQLKAHQAVAALMGRGPASEVY
ncbi:NAD(P)H-dependent glycerol-3-phosphate dehydrogenase [Rhodoferax sp.]|uniref:NAD(P)H-dependent glycerol-3-phosphate dehydrogenase n=1 Tax=Rhodoferax sp. TaxID=50421 RepID=UPI0025E9884D|nr:NAD(P)H-dependent glycerol-3-phosphate dehydrogenase [Rhodoferax sp.]